MLIPRPSSCAPRSVRVSRAAAHREPDAVRLRGGDGFRVTGIRVPEEHEMEGLDITQHGEEAYNLET